MNHMILSVIVLLSTIGLTFYMDDSESKVGIIGMIAVATLFIILSHPSTIHHVEGFKNDDNVRLRTLETLNELYKNIESTENAMNSLPKPSSTIMNELLHMKQQVKDMMKTAGNKETFENKTTCDHPDIQAKLLKEKIDKIVKIINKEVADAKTENDFCNNKMICSFLKYILSVNPDAFFDPPLKQASKGKESNLEKEMDYEQTVDVYRNRALALIAILKKRRQFNCNTLHLEIGCKGSYKGFLPVTELKIKDRSFTMDPLEAQELLHNPQQFEQSLSVEMPSGKAQTAQMDAIVRVMQLMAYLKDSKESAKTNPSLDTTIYVLV